MLSESASDQWSTMPKNKTGRKGSIRSILKRAGSVDRLACQQAVLSLFLCVCQSALVEKWQPFTKVSSSHQLSLAPLIHSEQQLCFCTACRRFGSLPRNSWERQLALPPPKSEHDFTCGDLNCAHGSPRRSHSASVKRDTLRGWMENPIWSQSGRTKSNLIRG